jgi:Kdo2-lipid IVA lauroyltransferase/acyltransferase
MKHPVRRRFMYLGFQGLRALAQAVPLGACRAIGRIIGSLAYAGLAGQRRLTLDQLREALGKELPERDVRRIGRGVFQNLGQSFMEWLHLPAIPKGGLQKLVECEGLEHLRGALAQGNGAVVLTAHLGNWEIIPLYLGSLGFQGGVLARRLRYPEYESFLINLRGSYGIPTLARGSLKEVARLLRENRIVGMLPDQDMDSLEGIFVDFFGRPAKTPVGPAALSVMTGAPILPCFLVRDGAKFRLIIEPPVARPAVQDRTELIAALTRAWSAIMETYIRRYPGQWVWMHRRWKSQPEAGAAPAAQPSRPGPTLGAVTALFLAACCALLPTGCGGKASKPASPERAEETDPNADQAMSGFQLAGYEPDGSKRWELHGEGAVLDGDVVTIKHPNATAFEPGRTAWMTASVAAMRQSDRHVRLEQDVTVHTSDGMWFTSPVIHWIPDYEQVVTDQPIRMETDHMLLRGRGLRGLAHLKQATVMEDVELVLNPTERTLDEAATGGHVRITCDGPLSFDYENDIAVFENNVHVEDPSGDLYSDKLVAYMNRNPRTIRYAEASGKVRIHQNQNTAAGERAVYEPSKSKITLVGKPSLLIYPDGSASTSSMSLGALAPEKRVPEKKRRDAAVTD